MTASQRLDAFPTQLVLTIAWCIAGTWITFAIGQTAVERTIIGISVYANVISHWSAHLAWRAKREAQADE